MLSGGALSPLAPPVEFSPPKMLGLPSFVSHLRYTRTKD